jgi:hypothetical protein
MTHHEHILRRINEDIGLTPSVGVGTMAGDVHSGDSSTLARPTKHAGDDYREGDPEERREIKIADAILQAVSGLASSPAADEIKNQALELKRIHGVK